MGKVVRIEYFGMDGEGRNVTEAKKDAGRKLEQFVRQAGMPKFLCYRSATIVMWRGKEDWLYGFLRDGDISGWSYHPGGYDECRMAAAHHLAQNECDQDEIITESDVPEFVTDRHDRRELVRYMMWQRAARFAQRVLELESNDVHAWACEHEREFEGIRSDEYVAEPEVAA